MKPLVISVKDEYGFVFEGECPHTFAFVPEDCIMFQDDGSVEIDKMAYLNGGWAVRNMRFNDTDPGGTRLFPNARKPVVNAAVPELVSFLDRLHRGYGARFVAPPGMAASSS